MHALIMFSKFHIIGLRRPTMGIPSIVERCFVTGESITRLRDIPVTKTFALPFSTHFSRLGCGH